MQPCFHSFTIDNFKFKIFQILRRLANFLCCCYDFQYWWFCSQKSDRQLSTFGLFIIPSVYKKCIQKIDKVYAIHLYLNKFIKDQKNQQTLARLDCFVKLQMFWKIRIKEKLNDESRHKLDIKRTNRFKVNKVWVKTCEIYLWFVETAQEKLKWQKLNQINDIFDVSMRSTTVFG